MVFGTSKLQDEIFCLKEERDYFQSKFLDQVSKYEHLKEELRLARKEISKLRGELLRKSDDEKRIESTSSKTSDTEFSSSSASVVDDDDDDEEENHREEQEEENVPRVSERRSRGTELEPTEEVVATTENEDEESDCADCDDDATSARELRENALQLLRWADNRRSSSDVPRTIESTNLRSSS